MKNLLFSLPFFMNPLFVILLSAQETTYDYPCTQISNETVRMKLYLPDPENGYYRGTRFEWSGIISSLEYDGHQYFGEWKKSHDPFIHEDISGPVESSGNAGLGYNEAKPGEMFIRIGVGVLENRTKKNIAGIILIR